jgi:hypothetical protein
VWSTVELPDVHDVALIFENSSFVIVHIEVIGCREDGHDGGKACAFRFAVHAVSVDLCQQLRVRFDEINMSHTQRPALHVRV